MSRRTTQAQVNALADALAAPSLDDIVEHHCDAWHALIDSVNGTNTAKELDASVEMEEQLRAALPAKHHELLVKYSDHRGSEGFNEARAAYMLGIAVGRRLGGAR